MCTFVYSFVLLDVTLSFLHAYSKATYSRLYHIVSTNTSLLSSDIEQFNSNPHHHTTTTMSSADAQLAFQRNEPLQRVEAQETFSQQFDLASPDKAMSSYQRSVALSMLYPWNIFLTRCRLMHQHTKQQFQSASDSSRRRSSGGDNNRMSTLSSQSSVDSTAS